jgi:exopolyphosphatase/guanosine-5'-triphosphate,3'-diphosphate pyrophosphatase
MSMERVGIIDVGSNTVRLLVAGRVVCGDVEPVREERAVIGLGAEIERSGRIPGHKVAEAARCTRRYARLARAEGCSTIDVVVTAPGRQSTNAPRLLQALERAAGSRPRVLSAEEEGRLAYLGAMLRADGGIDGRVAVCDVGGGSTELAVGLAGGLPEWLASLDIGSLRLAGRCLAEAHPGRRALAEAHEHARRALEAVVVPGPVGSGLATGGAARAVRRLVGRSLGPEALADAIAICADAGPAGLVELYDIDPQRAPILAAGTVILAEVQALLGVPLDVARGGLREGLAHTLLPELAAA